MKNRLNTCECFQLTISEKFDDTLALDHSEYEHIESCAECQEFYNFVYGVSFQHIACAPADEALALEGSSQSVSIMEILTRDEPDIEPVKRGNVIRLSLAIAAVAALATVTISQVMQPAIVEENSQAVVLDEVAPKKKLSLPDLSIPEINLDEQYSAINTVVVSRIETVTDSIETLRGYFVEGNAFLDEHTQSEPEGSPESYHQIESKHSKVC